MAKEKIIKIISSIVFYIVIGVLILYLGAPLLFKYNDLYENFKVRRYLSIALILLLIVKLIIDKFNKVEEINLLNSLFLILSGVLSFVMINYLHIYSLLTVALISLTGGLFIKEYGAVITIGAFLGSSVGMDFYSLALSLVFASIISESLKNTFLGIGGKLGTISFVSVFLSFQILKVSFGEASFYSFYEILIILATTLISALLTFYINNKLNKGPIVSFSIITIVGIILFHYLFETKIDLASIVYGASFIGMTKKNKRVDYLVIILSSFIFSTILFINVLYKGPGGLFGTTALLSVLVSKLIVYLKSIKSVEEESIN